MFEVAPTAKFALTILSLHILLATGRTRCGAVRGRSSELRADCSVTRWPSRSGLTDLVRLRERAQRSPSSSLAAGVQAQCPACPRAARQSSEPSALPCGRRGPIGPPHLDLIYIYRGQILLVQCAAGQEHKTTNAGFAFDQDSAAWTIQSQQNRDE